MNNAKHVVELFKKVESYLQTEAPGGIYFHCRHGEDRTGMMIRILRELSGTDEAVAIKEFRTYGGSPYKALRDLHDNVRKLFHDDEGVWSFRDEEAAVWPARTRLKRVFNSRTTKFRS